MLFRCTATGNLFVFTGPLGFDIQTIKACCSLAESEDDTRVLRKEMLQERRDQHLKNAHRIKKTLDCLDAVLQKLKSVTGGGT